LAYTPVFNPRGYVQVTNVSAAVGIGALPDGATRASIQAESQDVRWRDDGTNPTTSVGMVLKANATLDYAGDMAAIKFIETSASAKLNVAFY
jgi:hypothetical protein